MDDRVYRQCRFLTIDVIDWTKPQSMGIDKGASVDGDAEMNPSKRCTEFAGNILKWLMNFGNL